MNNTRTLSVHVRTYTDAIRGHLADLPVDTIEELTGGLEADLTEALADLTDGLSDGAGMGYPVGPSASRPAVDEALLDLSEVFGPADRYAAELRSAAGLRSAPVGRGDRSRLSGVTSSFARAGAQAARLRDGWQVAWRPMTASPGWQGMAGFTRSLAPIWWVLRGWVVAAILLWPINQVIERLEWQSGYSDGAWPLHNFGVPALATIAAVVVSVQWGRGMWVPQGRWAPRAVAVVSFGAVAVGVPMVVGIAQAEPWNNEPYNSGFEDGYAASTVQVQAGASAGTAVDGTPLGSDGVWVDGMQVSNLFVYDAEGFPLRDVQIFDDRGRAVRTVTDAGVAQRWAVPEMPGEWYFQPSTATDGRERWNAYPLDAVASQDIDLERGEAFGDMFQDPQTGAPKGPEIPTGVQPQDMPWPFLQAPTAIDRSGGAEPKDVESEDAESGERATDGEMGGATRRVPAEPDDQPEGRVEAVVDDR